MATETRTCTHFPKSALYKVYVALMMLLILTVGVSMINLGPFNFAVAMLIALTKMLLVVYVFMNVRFSIRAVWVYSALGFLWLILLLGGLFSDYLTRHPL